MLKLAFTRTPETTPCGWMVEVCVPVVGAKEPMQRLFAVGADNGVAAARLTRHALGNLHCRIVARMRLRSGALSSLKVGEGEIQEIDAD